MCCVKLLLYIVGITAVLLLSNVLATAFVDVESEALRAEKW